MKDNITLQIEEQFQLWQHIRQHLHRHPELSFNETETSKFICNLLDEWKIDYEKGWVKTGIVATIKGNNPDKKLIAVRADLDALPIQEKTNASYKSVHDGIMHACGHDVHTTCALGALRMINSLKNQIEGTVQFVFQPGEEKWPGGAKLMLDEGLFSDKKPKAIFALHVFPELKAGELGLKSGAYMASADEIYITFKGKGGHGAMPEKCIDPVMMSAQFLVQVQQVISRIIPATLASVLTFGKIEANGATNVIPDEVKLSGTFRIFDEKWRFKAHEHIEKIARNVAQALGGEAVIDIKVGYPCLVNNERLTDNARKTLEKYFDKENVFDLPMRMTAEDFAYFAQQMPACFIRLGTAASDGRFTNSVHHPEFDIDEKALITGIELLTRLVLESE